MKTSIALFGALVAALISSNAADAAVEDQSWGQIKKELNTTADTAAKTVYRRKGLGTAKAAEDVSSTQPKRVFNIGSVKLGQDPELGGTTPYDHGDDVHPAGSPDLVVPLIEITGAKTISPEGYVIVPVRVVVRNQGDYYAGKFKIALDYTTDTGTFRVAFKVSGESSLWYPSTDDILPAGAEVSFEGTAIFHSSTQGKVVSLIATADICGEFSPAHCSVSESDETNNTSEALSTLLPRRFQVSPRFFWRTWF